jgi:hypothetical protein
MKRVLIIAICSAFATGLCQEPRPAASPLAYTASQKGAEAFSIRAASVSQSGNRVHLRSVEIRSGAALIRADSADFDPATGQLKPHGKVTISFQKMIAGGIPANLMKEILPR